MKSLETGPFSFKIVNLGRRFSPLTKLVFLSDEQFDGIMSYELTITNCQQHYEIYAAIHTYLRLNSG